MNHPLRPAVLLAAFCFSGTLLADDIELIRFFEQRIRPVLVEHCFQCHSSAKKKRGGLLLDSRNGILKGGDSGPAIVPGKPAASLLVEVLEYEPDGIRMPPKGRLSPGVLKDFRRWIETGAIWPDSQSPPETPAGQQSSDARHWSFQPIVRPTVPKSPHSQWPRNAIDHFVLKRMIREGLQPAPTASPHVLVRRLSYDLTGLPPSAGQLQSNVTRPELQSPAKTIDELLASKRYGEHWGGHWLDGVRYVSDVGYYNFSDLGWRYRDWVIRALNADMPYSDFVTHQIAGDLLPPPNGQDVYADGIIATGVLAMGNYDDQESNKEQLYAEVIDDQIDVVSRQFLGLTISCARCHDHKFDPISTADYYSLGGIFMSSRVLKAGNRIGAPRLQIALNSEADAKRHHEWKAQIEELQKLIEDVETAERPPLEAELQELIAKSLSPPGKAIGIQEGGYSDSRHTGISDMPIYVRGNPHQPGKITPRQLPVVFAGADQIPISAQTSQSGRLELARWIASSRNPLTARVIVNRLWHYHFGQALVRTPNNFGFQGARPTHPELLDYLASELTDSGWSLKHIHRLILNSATWQQAAISVADTESQDPDNRFLARGTIRRLSAEQLHDSILFLSGQLRETIGKGGNRLIYRRVGHEFHSHAASLFDAPAVGTIAPVRTQSTTSTQSLYLLNDSLVSDAARRIAGRYHDLSTTEFANAVWAHLYGCPPGTAEIKASIAYLDGREQDRRWTWVQVLLCSNKFLYLQ